MHIFRDTRAAAAGIADIPSFLSTVLPHWPKFLPKTQMGPKKIERYAVIYKSAEEFSPDLSKAQKGVEVFGLRFL